ncbi:MAG TPA: hypothetical protein VLZ54_03400, partial [Arenibacter sp.]|nr:hypothetical protein [Arenibacter sp.]
MKKLVPALLFFIASFVFGQEQTATVTVVPTVFGENEPITLTISNVDLAVWGVKDLYLWAWTLDANGKNPQDSPTNGSWTSSGEAQKLTDNGDGTYSYTLIPATFFNRTNIGEIGMLIKTKNGNKQTKDYTFKVGTFQLNLVSPNEDVTILNAGEILGISGTSSVTSDFVLTANGVQIDQ